MNLTLREAQALRQAADIPVVVSTILPFHPSPSEDIGRIVRHGLADVLTWLGQEVGPKPGEPTHAMMIGVVLYVSPELDDRIRAASSTSVQPTTSSASPRTAAPT